MILDKLRLEAYLAAMEKVIKPGDVVLDIGAGPAILSMLAVRMGARKVIAVECNPSIRLGKRLIQINDLSKTVQCIQGLSTELTLESPADVIIADLRGVLPFFSQNIPSIIDARERLLAPGGTLIGCKDTLFSAPVEHPEEYRRVEEPWRINQFGLDLTAAAEFEINRWSKVNLRPTQLLADGRNWETLDYRTVTQPSAHGRLSWEIQRVGRLHGIATWFDAELAPGAKISNHPNEPELIYGQAFMPVPRAIDVQPGFHLDAQIHAHWVKQHYVWQWKGQIRDQTGTLIDKFDQSSVGKTLSNRDLSNG